MQGLLENIVLFIVPAGKSTFCHNFNLIIYNSSHKYAVYFKFILLALKQI